MLKSNRLHIPLDLRERLAFQEERNKTEVMLHWRMRLDLSGPESVRVDLADVMPFHLGGLRASAFNCAAITVLLDCAVAISGMLQFPSESCATVDLSIKIMRPAFSRVWATGAALRKSDHLVFAEAELFDGDRLCACATGIVAVSPQKPRTVELGHREGVPVM